MRLRIHISTSNEELISLVNEGYDTIFTIKTDYQNLKNTGNYNDRNDVDALFAPFNVWLNKVIISLERIFPTRLESHIFLDQDAIQQFMVNEDSNYHHTIKRCLLFVRSLNKIRQQSLSEYTDLPLDARLYVEDIDSFRKVRDINPAMVAEVLCDGYLNKSEDSVQTALERILNVPFHKKDWGGELNDLYTANLVVNGTRHETAFLLKGNGLRSHTMEIKHCGANGDQILRLCNSPAKIFIIQFIGRVSEAIISDIDGKIRHARTQGKDAWYCIIDGQDTARVLRAYGEL